MSVLDNSYINKEQLITLGERNLTFGFKVAQYKLSPKECIEYDEVARAFIADLKNLLSLKMRCLQPVIDKYYPINKYLVNVTTNYHEFIIKVRNQNPADMDAIVTIVIGGIRYGAGYL